jgi:hypothetical protein
MCGDIATKNCLDFALVLAPDHRHVASDLAVAVYARVKCVAALKSDGDDVALGPVVCALVAFIDADAVHSYAPFHQLLAVIRQSGTFYSLPAFYRSSSRSPSGCELSQLKDAF